MTYAELVSCDDYRALVRGIAADPDADLPRLVAADWLEESGFEGRAEFIRDQVAGVNRPVPTFVAEQIGGCPNQYDGSLVTGRDGVRYAFRRGFAESVTLTLSALVGGDCERCRGSATSMRVRSRDGEFAVVDLEPCEACSGAGRTPGLAAVLFAAHPLTAVTLSDRRPFDAPGHPASYDWATEPDRDYAVFADMPHMLPEELFRRLTTPDADWGGGHASYFGSNARARALAALSAACVGYGRSLAGLPPIPAPKI